MNGIWIALLILVILAALVIMRVLEAGRVLNAKPDTREVQTAHGILLSLKGDLLAASFGKPSFFAVFQTDDGEQMKLEVHFIQLYRSMKEGSCGLIRFQGNVLQDFITDPEQVRTERKGKSVMGQKTVLKNAAIRGVGVKDILIEDERILAVGESLSAADAQEIDLSGKIVLPGFFNAHVHLYGVEGPLPDELIQSFVTGGCTTVRDMGMTSELPFEAYMEWLSARKSPEYPFVLTSGKFLCGVNTYGDIHPSGKQIGYRIEETPEGAARAVDVMVDAGADQIKTGLDYGMDIDHPLNYFSEEVFRAICRRAKERGVPSSAHITKRDNFVKAAQWGLTENGHTPTNALTDEDIEEVVRCGMKFNTTASIFDMVSSETGEEIMDDVISNIGRLYRAGVPMSIGTDYMHEGAPYQTAGIPVHELQLLIKAGLTVDEAIDAATVDTANVIGVGADLGSIEAGKIADIIAVDQEIDETFEALKPEHVVFVMHRGAVIRQDQAG